MRSEWMLLLASILSFFMIVLAIYWVAFSSMLSIMFVMLGIATGSTILIAILFAPRLSLGIVAARPEVVQSYLAYELRCLQYQVSDKPKKIVTNVDKLSAIELHFNSTTRGTKVSYRALPTQTGWGVIIAPIWLVMPSFLTLISAPLIYFKSIFFVKKRISPLLPKDGFLRELPRVDDIGTLLVTCAAENHRLFTDAYKAEKTSYWNAQGYIIMAGFLTSLVLFLLLSLMSTEADLMSKTIGALIPAIIGTLAFALPLMWIVRLRYKPRLKKWNIWIERMGAVWRKEAAKTAPEESAPSSFEILVEAAKEAPLWNKTRRKAALSRDWGAWAIIFIIVWFWIQFTISGIVQLMSTIAGASSWHFIYNSILLIAGIILIIGAWIYYRHWKRHIEEDLNKELETWKHSLEKLSSRMEHFLEEL